jgi:hypothetical protein
MTRWCFAEIAVRKHQLVFSDILITLCFVIHARNINIHRGIHLEVTRCLAVCN